MQKDKFSFWKNAAVLAAVSALAYLPLIGNIGYVNDDWYLMYDLQVKGPDFMHAVFAIDRPARAYTLGLLTGLFGLDPLPYHLNLFFFRVLGAIFLYLLFTRLWPRFQTVAWSAALLFAIYPGFLSQVNPVDYQPQIIALFLAILSLNFTVWSASAQHSAARWLHGAAAVFAGWAYLSQVEYFLGVEAIRVALLAILVWRAGGELQARLRWLAAAAFPFLIIPGGFLAWRLLLFESARKATDAGAQLGRVIENPALLLTWARHFGEDLLTVSLTAWVESLPRWVSTMTGAELGAGAALAFVAAGGVIWQLRKQASGPGERPAIDGPAVGEALFLGAVGLAGGLLPVIMVNRHVDLPDYSRYALIPALGAVLLISAAFARLARREALPFLFGLLVFLSVLTHYGNGVKHARETAAMRDFWWQVAWRAPGIEEGTTLLVFYPGNRLAEDYFIWGPANFLYYPERQEGRPAVQVRLPAALLSEETLEKIASGSEPHTRTRRGNYTRVDYGNILLIAQTVPGGCAHLVNGSAPEIPPSADPRVARAAPYSNASNVLTEAAAPDPFREIFGAEPARGWCYYYQKADLARQREQWIAIPDFWDAAAAQGLRPADSMELLPFLQAEVLGGQLHRIQSVLAAFDGDGGRGLRMCEIMQKFALSYAVSSEANLTVSRALCR